MSPMSQVRSPPSAGQRQMRASHSESALLKQGAGADASPRGAWPSNPRGAEPDPDSPSRPSSRSRSQSVASHTAQAILPYGAFGRDSIMERFKDEAVGNHIVDFHTWVNSLPQGWQRLHQLFLKEGIYLDRSTGKGLTKERWLSLLNNMGFAKYAFLMRFEHLETAEAVFDQILVETSSDAQGSRSSRRRSQSDFGEPSPEPEITLAQFRRFEKKAIAVSMRPDYGDLCCGRSDNREHAFEQSPAARFCKYLRERSGTVLRAWHLDLDKRGTGRIGWTDFVSSCRKLGVADQAKLVWQNILRDKSDPMLLVNLCKDEGNNLEDFTKCLWVKHGCNLVQAWRQLTSMREKQQTDFVTPKDFKDWCQDVLKFRGDPDLVFKGLDTVGLKRLLFSDFQYINKVSREAQERLGTSDKTNCKALSDLVSWAQSELKCSMNDPEDLLSKLAIPNRQNIMVGDLAARLTALGFEGNALEAAHRIARDSVGHRSGTRTNTTALLNALAGKTRPKSARAQRRSPSTAREPRTANPERGWDPSVYNYSDKNINKCKYDRHYFPLDGDSQSGDFSLRHSTISAPNSARPRSPTKPELFSEKLFSPRKPEFEQRFLWDSTSNSMHQVSNTKLPSHTRKYFSNSDRKPNSNKFTDSRYD